MMSILHTHGRGGKSTAHVTTVDGDWSASGGWQFHFLRLARNFSMKTSLKSFHLNLNFKCQTVGERFDCYANDCNHVTCHLLTRRSTRNRFAAGHVWFWVAEIRQIPGGHSSEYLPVTQHWRVTPPCAVAASASARRRRQGDSSCRNARYHYLVAIECGESAANETFQPCDRQRHFWLALGLDLFHYLHNSKMLIRHFLKESKKLLSYLAPRPTGRTWCHWGGKESRDLGHTNLVSQLISWKISRLSGRNLLRLSNGLPKWLAIFVETADCAMERIPFRIPFQRTPPGADPVGIPSNVERTLVAFISCAIICFQETNDGPFCYQRHSKSMIFWKWVNI